MDSRCKKFVGMVCGTISHYGSVSRSTMTGKKLAVASAREVVRPLTVAHADMLDEAMADADAEAANLT